MIPPEIQGHEHLFLPDHARPWFDAGGNPCELQRSNLQGTRRPQPVWTFWLAQAQAIDTDWGALIQGALDDPRFDPWLPDQNGDPSWWQTLRGWRAEAWGQRWAARGLDPNRWNDEPDPAYPCLLSMWLATTRGRGLMTADAMNLTDRWVREHGLDLQAIDPRTGNGAWHWLAHPRGRATLGDPHASALFATWLIDWGVSPERTNHTGVSGWEAWTTACQNTEARDTVNAHWAQVENAHLRASLANIDTCPAPLVRRASRL